MTPAPILEWLDALGLSEPEKLIYAFALSNPLSSATEVATRLDIDRGKLRRAVGELEAKGLIARTGTKPIRYRPASPEKALEALARHQHDLIDEAHLKAATLAKSMYQGGQNSNSEQIEIVDDEQLVHQRTAQVCTSARHEILRLSRPPYFMTIEESRIQTTAPQVRERTIFDHAGVSYPGHLDFMMEDDPNDIHAKEWRVIPELPLKLTISDRAVALMFLKGREQDMTTAIVVRSTPVIDALVVLFETLWERAVPLDLGAAEIGAAEIGAAEIGAAEITDDVSPEDRKLMLLLSTGLKDEAIARQLGISDRSLRRRMAVLFDRLDSQNRFQAGVQAARRQWIH